MNNEDLNQGNNTNTLNRTEPMANNIDNSQIDGIPINAEEINGSIPMSEPSNEPISQTIDTIDPVVNISPEVTPSAVQTPAEPVVTPNVESRNVYSEPPVNITQEQPMINASIGSNIVEPSATLSESKPISIESPKKKSKNGILIGIIVLLILAVAGVFVYLKFFGNISHKVYQLAIEKGIGNVFEGAHTDDAYQYDISFDINLDVSEEILPKEIKDLVNGLKLNLITQIDKVNHQAFVKLDTTHQNESILKADVFAELNNNIAYVHLPDFLDKYIITENNDFSEITKSIDKKYDYKTIEKILKREVVKLVKEEECTNEDNYYVWKVNNKDLSNRLQTMLNTLKNDKEFTEAIGSSGEAEELFKSINIDSSSINESFDITFKLNDKSYDISFPGYSISGEIQDETVTYNVKQQGSSIVNGSITIKGSDDNKTMNLVFVSPQVGTIKVNMTTKYSKLEKVDEIDKSNAIKSEEISAEESQLMMQKLQESKLYALISSLIPQDDPYNSSYDDPYNSSYNVEPVDVNRQKSFTIGAKQALLNAEEYIEEEKLDGPVAKKVFHNKYTDDFNYKKEDANLNICVVYDEATIDKYKLFMSDGTLYVEDVTYTDLKNLSNVKVVDSSHINLSISSEGTTCVFSS